MSNVWYTSDLHIGHKLVSSHRGFDVPNPEFSEKNPIVPMYVTDTDAHDAHIAAEWDRLVGKDDQVFILGDMSINGSQHMLDWTAARPGRKHLIAGNHDPIHPGIDRRAGRLLPHWLLYFETIQPFGRRKLNGKSFAMSHFPYWPHDRGEPRYQQWRLPNDGLPLLHGHTHSDKVFEFENSFHVGWDAHGTLVPQEQVQEWIESL